MIGRQLSLLPPILSMALPDAKRRLACAAPTIIHDSRRPYTLVWRAARDVWSRPAAEAAGVNSEASHCPRFGCVHRAASAYSFNVADAGVHPMGSSRLLVVALLSDEFLDEGTYRTVKYIHWILRNSF